MISIHVPKCSKVNPKDERHERLSKIQWYVGFSSLHTEVRLTPFLFISESSQSTGPLLVLLLYSLKSPNTTCSFWRTMVHMLQADTTFTASSRIPKLIILLHLLPYPCPYLGSRALAVMGDGPRDGRRLEKRVIRICFMSFWDYQRVIESLKVKSYSKLIFA